MITTEVDYLDGEITVDEQEPNTLKELLPLFGEPMIVDETVSNLRYRNKHPRVYKKVSDRIHSKFPKDVKKEEKLKDGTLKKVLVSDLDHIRAYWKSGPDAQAELTSLFNEIAPAEPLFVKGERGLGGKIRKTDVDFANLCFAQGDDVVEAKVQMIEAMIPNYKVSRNGENAITPEALARGVQALNNYLKKQATKAAKAALGT